MKAVDELGRFLVRLVSLTLIILVVIQGLMTQDDLRLYLSMGERLEGPKIEVPALMSSEKSISEERGDYNETGDPASFELVLQDYSMLPKALVLINSQVVGSMKSGRVKLYVNEGDLVEIDTRLYPDPVRIKTARVSAGLDFPREGMTITCEKSIVALGKVQVK